MAWFGIRPLFVQPVDRLNDADLPHWLSPSRYSLGMAMSVHEIAERLNSEAARLHMETSELIDVLAAQLGDAKKRSIGFANLGASTSGQDSRDIDQMLADGFGRD